jgi:hypothetical protein
MAAVDLGRRAAVKPRMVAALTRNIDLDLLSSFPTARIPLVEPSIRPD